MASHPDANEASSSSEAQSAYNELKRLIPSLAAELELLRTSLREHSLWLLRYGHGTSVLRTMPGERGGASGLQGIERVATIDRQNETGTSPHEQDLSANPGPQSRSSPGTASSQSPSAPTEPPPAFSETEPPAYSASDVPPYTGGFSTVSASTREEVQARRDQLTEWLREGEDVLREYSARYAQLAEELGLPQEDLLGTWHEAHPDNALPGYQRIERDQELMVGGVGEVPPPYLGGRPQGIGPRGNSDPAAGSSSKGRE